MAGDYHRVSDSAGSRSPLPLALKRLLQYGLLVLLPMALAREEGLVYRADLRGCSATADEVGLTITQYADGLLLEYTGR